jgi:murein DD-endopeptidase MepM/ murein hydrolase activator NlpD
MNILQLIGLLLTILTAQQGQAIRLSLPDQPGIQGVRVEWQGKSIPYTKIGKEWISVIGVDLDVKPGEYLAEIYVIRDGAVENSAVTVNVKAVKFPVEHLQVAEQFVELSPENTERALREAKELEAIHNSITPEALWREPFIVPIPGGVGVSFGKRRVFNGESRNPHAGADLKATTGTPIRSTNRGRVALAKDLFFTGNTVIVDHGLGVYTLYAHLSRMNVKEGEIIERGKILGLAGATGRVTGPHLHWGAKVQNTRVDPFSLINLGK